MNKFHDIFGEPRFNTLILMQLFIGIEAPSENKSLFCPFPGTFQAERAENELQQIKERSH